MRLFTCRVCDHVLFFENDSCMNCKSPVGYSPEAVDFVPVSPEEAAADGAFETVLPGGQSQSFRRCKNFEEGGACNWLVRVEDDAAYCLSCRLSEVIPDLSDASNRNAWLDIERAKRRLLYTLYALKLPVASKVREPEAGLSFKFLRGTEEAPVMTGHDGGVITLNIAEADAAYRENTRERLGEAYRTVLGHLRHESGHYYWDRLIRDSAMLEGFRALFGDERVSYEECLKRHYDAGPPANWAESFISSYATMHPWEDWAETWAHYLHMVDTLETAKSHGLSLRSLGTTRGEQLATQALEFRDFESLSAGWHVVTLALNNLNRSMGLKDGYPFIVSPPVQQKLRFVHDLIQHPAPKRAVPAKAPARAGSKKPSLP
ncbi:MAG TPA: putative zinc-binding metallopeptidase [Polyangiaceae bacterium]|nr:putative zinc-binding metallopeptidase [Polyangiaceae bacterium]